MDQRIVIELGPTLAGMLDSVGTGLVIFAAIALFIVALKWKG